MNPHTIRSLGIIGIMALIGGGAYLLYATVFGAATFGVDSQTSVVWNVAQGDKLTDGLTHMWSFDAPDMDISQREQNYSTTSIAGTGVNYDNGATVAWTSPGNITQDNNTNAIADVQNESSDYLKASNFGYTLPTNADVTGIGVTYEREGEQAGTVDALELKLVDNTGATTTEDRADTGTYWPTTAEVVSFAGEGDLWGRDWTASEINNSGFAVLLVGNRDSGGPRRQARVDHIDTTIYYQMPPTGTTTDTAGSIDGTLAGPKTTQGKIGQGLIFDGSNDSITHDTTVSFNTLSFWMKRDSTFMGLIDFSSSTPAYIAIDAAGEVITTGITGTTTIYIDSEVATFTKTDWHHIVITNTDGVIAPDFTLGYVATTSSYYKGKLDNIRTYDRVLTDHEIQRLYNMGGTATINTPQDNQIADGLISQWTFNGLNIRWGTSTTTVFDSTKALPDPEFGTGGFINVGADSNTIDSIAYHGGTHLFAFGTNGSDWRIEKRLVSDGSLDTGFGTNGVVTGATASDDALAIAIDSTYMYVAGDDATSDWRIEKRRLSDGSLVSGFGSGGVVTGVSASGIIYDIAIDSSYMYVAGDDATSDWRIEKRLLSDGSLDTGFGSNGVITGVTASNEARAIAIDSTYMYVAGDDATSDWRIEKRRLSDGSLVSGFGSSGVVTSDSVSTSAYAIVLDNTYMYVTGNNSSSNMRLEKRLLSDGSLVSGFGSGGVIDSVSLSNVGTAVLINGAYVYIGGYDDNVDWRIEKRILSDGSLDTGFGSGGVFTADGETYLGVAMTLDASSLYIAGYIGTSVALSDWRFEKRLLSDGSLVDGVAPGNSGILTDATPKPGRVGQALAFNGTTANVDMECLVGIEFGTCGVVTSDSNSNSPRAIAGDGSYLYIGGYQGSDPYDWRIEKRRISNGSLVNSFDTDGIVVSHSDSDRLYDITNDSSYLYAVGYDEVVLGWRIEKRRLSDAALCTAANCGTEFGTGGIITVGSLLDARAIAIDTTYMYVAGFGGTGGRIEKRLLTSGALCTSGNCGTEFGTSGAVALASDSSGIYSMAIDDTYLYSVGMDDNTDWRIEKRLLSDGSLDSGFGTNGVVTSTSISDRARDIVIDSTYMYVVGEDSNVDWRIEKRLLSTGATSTDFGTGGVVTVTPSIRPYGVVDDGTNLYIIGHDSGGWRIEKRLMSDGSLVSAFGNSGVESVSAPADIAYGAYLQNEHLYIIGNDTTPDWRIEKHRSDNGSTYEDPVRSTAFWIKADDTTIRPVLQINATNTIDIDGSSNVVATDFPGATIYVDGSSASPTIDTDWHHVVITDSTGVSPTSFQIGTDGTNYFDGILDEVRIYDRVLTNDEILRLYRMGK